MVLVTIFFCLIKCYTEVHKIVLWFYFLFIYSVLFLCTYSGNICISSIIVVFYSFILNLCLLFYYDSFTNIKLKVFFFYLGNYATCFFFISLILFLDKYIFTVNLRYIILTHSCIDDLYIGNSFTSIILLQSPDMGYFSQLVVRGFILILFDYILHMFIYLIKRMLHFFTVANDGYLKYSLPGRRSIFKQITYMYYFLKSYFNN